jgi:predicted ATPase
MIAGRPAPRSGLIPRVLEVGVACEVSATVELARLWQDQGRPADARARLQPVYAWFTEAFHSADLRAAKTLLDELG